MIEARDFVASIAKHCRPSDGVSILSEHHWHHSTEYTQSDVVLVVGNGEVIIVPDEYYLREEAKRRLGTGYTGTFTILEREK